MQKIISGLIILVGFINFYPIIGMFSSASIDGLYQIGKQSEDVAILLRHRAVLFGIVGGLMMYAAFRQDLQPLAFTMGLISMLGFLIITLLEGPPGEGIHKVFMVDLLATVGLVIALALKIWSGNATA